MTPGLLVSAAPADLQTGEVTISGLAPEAFPMASAGPNANANANAGIPIQIESGITEVGDQGTLSFSTNVTVADPGGVVDLGPQVMEPQMCAVDRNDEPEGDLPGKHARHRGNRRHGVDLIGPVKDGFRADAQLDPVDDLSIFYNQEGDGHVGLLMFFREGGFRVAPLLALYRCRDGDCEFLRAQGRALRLGISADAKFADLGDGLLRATWLIENVPGDVEAIRYRLFTQGDRFPNGFPFLESVDLPDLCTGGLSNDPRFWIGG